LPNNGNYSFYGFLLVLERLDFDLRVNWKGYKDFLEEEQGDLDWEEFFTWGEERTGCA
jgi:hypothetical protein